MTSNIAIQRAIDNIVSTNGRAFVKQPLTVNVRIALRALANTLEVAPTPLWHDWDAIDDNELTTLYATARKSFSSAQAMAVGIRNRLANSGTANPLFDPTPPQAPRTGPNPEPAPRDPSQPRTAPQPEPRNSIAFDDLETLIAAARVAGEAGGRDAGALVADERLSDALDGLEELVAAEARKAVAAVQPTNLIVTLPEQAPVALGVVHETTPKVILALSAGVNVYLYGPAGSGKTTSGQQCANAFGLSFHFSGKMEDEYGILGFILPSTGEVVRTPFREAYEHGGFFLFDELDRSSPAAVVALNAALANGVCAFPDAIVQRHENFKCVAAGNTVMTGASRLYTAGAQMDASSIDRFAFIEFGYDETLELALATNKDWARHVQRVRAAVLDRGLPHLVTPRATIDGGKLLAAGFDWDMVETMCIYKGLDEAIVAQIKGAL